MSEEYWHQAQEDCYNDPGNSSGTPPGPVTLYKDCILLPEYNTAFNAGIFAQKKYRQTHHCMGLNYDIFSNHQYCKL